MRSKNLVKWGIERDRKGKKLGKNKKYYEKGFEYIRKNNFGLRV